MIITRLNIDNLYGFSNIEIDLSYKRKNSKSSIPNEFLPERPNFNFKRVCIISGTNASGKTSLGKVICGLENFLRRKNIIKYLNAICDKTRPASVLIEFVTPSDNIMHQLELDFIDSSVAIRKLKYITIPIGIKDSCVTMRKRIETIKKRGKNHNGIYIDSEIFGISRAFDEFSEVEIDDLGWMFMFSENKIEDRVNAAHHASQDLVFRILNSFDSSIKSVDAVIPQSETKKLNKSKNKKGVSDITGYIIKFHNNDSVLINVSGEIAGSQESANRFSKGTYDAIKLTNFIGRVIVEGKTKESCTHFLDEQMAYSHSYLEQHILNLIIEKLSPTAQFFYTTHNYDVLDMGFPSHSFLFMRKDGNYTSIVQPENSFSKNDRSLINYVKNNYFNTLPDTSNLDKLMWED